MFYSLLSKQQLPQLLPGFVFIAFLEEALLQTITVRINYIINNNAVINNNYGIRQDLILVLKIPMGSRKNFFEIYRQFGHAPSKSSPALV